MAPIEKTKGNDGARMGGTIVRAEQGGEKTFKGSVCPHPSSVQKNTKTNKQQQQVEPAASPQRSVSKHGSKDGTQPVTDFFFN